MGGGADEEGWGGEAVGLHLGGFDAARGHGGWLCVLRALASSGDPLGRICD